MFGGCGGMFGGLVGYLVAVVAFLPVAVRCSPAVTVQLPVRSCLPRFWLTESLPWFDRAFSGGSFSGNRPKSQLVRRLVAVVVLFPAW